MKAFSIGLRGRDLRRERLRAPGRRASSASSTSPRRCARRTCSTWSTWRSTSSTSRWPIPSYLPTFLLSRLAARHVKVVVGGDGGDELWGGYPTYRAHRWPRSTAAVPGCVRDGVVARAGRARCRSTIATRASSGSCAGSPSAGTTTASRATCAGCPASTCRSWRGGAGGARAARRRRSRRACPRRRDWLNQILALDFTTYMPGSVLTKVDRASMAHGLEVRPPLLDNALVDLAFSLPRQRKLRGTAEQVPAQARRARPASPTRSSTARRRASASRSPPGCAARWRRASTRSSPSRRCGTWASATRRSSRRWHGEHRDGSAIAASRLWALYVLDRWLRRARPRKLGKKLTSTMKGRAARERLAEAGAGRRARVDRDRQVDRQQLLVDAERVVQHAEAVADVVEDVLAREAVVVAAADGAASPNSVPARPRTVVKCSRFQSSPET